jgi:ankyrin repeat protein
MFAALQKTLLAAVDGQKIKIVEQLLDRGIPPPTEPGRNCIAKAIHHRDPAILKLLLDFGADPDAKNEHGRTPLRTASEHRKEAVVRFY